MTLAASSTHVNQSTNHSWYVPVVATTLPTGIVPIINTPFDDQGELDLASLERALEQNIKDGIAGCIVPAVASEVHKLTLDERRRLLEAALQIVDGRIPVIAGASAQTLDDVRDAATHAVRAGSPAVLVQLPDQLTRDADEIEAFYLAVADVGMDLLVVQDLEWGGPGMPVELIVRLFERIPAFGAIKIETVPAGLKYSAVIEATAGRLPVIGGWALPQMIEGLDRGAHAFTPTAINKAFVHVDHLYRHGRRQEAVELFERVVPVLAFCNQHIDISVHFLKRYYVRRGIFRSPFVRPPALPYDEHHQRYGDELIERLIAIEDQLPTLGPAG